MQRLSKPLNVLFIGPQHSGKSTLINTILKFLDSILVPVCDVGRRVQVGTIYYTKVVSKNQKFCFFDIAGRPFEDCQEADLDVLKHCLKGINVGADLIQFHANRPTINENNKIDLVFFVCPVDRWNNQEMEKFLQLKNRICAHVGHGNLQIILTHGKTTEKKVDHVSPLIIIENHLEFSRPIPKELENSLKTLVTVLETSHYMKNV